MRYGTYQLRSTVGLLYQDPKTLCYESTYQIYDMTNIGIVPCLDQVHVYIDTGYFTIALRTAAEIYKQYSNNIIPIQLRPILDRELHG